jgi:hypothetical protein
MFADILMLDFWPQSRNMQCVRRCETIDNLCQFAPVSHYAYVYRLTKAVDGQISNSNLGGIGCEGVETFRMNLRVLQDLEFFGCSYDTKMNLIYPDEVLELKTFQCRKVTSGLFSPVTICITLLLKYSYRDSVLVNHLICLL